MKNPRALAQPFTAPSADRRLQTLSPLLTLTEVADFLSVSDRTVRRLVASGKLPCARVGCQLRFLPSDILRQLQAWKE